MRSLISAALILCGAALVACSSTATAPSGSVVMDDTGTAVSTSGSNPMPTTSPLLNEGGWLVYVRSGDLYVGALDGSHEQQLTSGRAMPDFAGYARDDANMTWVYYTSVVQRRSDAGALMAVDRKSVDGKASEELFTFQANVQELASSPPIATVSPDGQYIAYTDERGLRLYDVASRSERGLLSDSQPGPGNTPGNIYLSPLWAPAGGWLVVTRTGYPPNDKPTLDFIRPLEPITEYTADAGGAFRAWSPDGTRLCASHAGHFNKGFTSDDVGLVVPGQSQFQTLLQTSRTDKPGVVPTQVAPNACVWSADGRVGISYLIEQANGGAVTVFNRAGTSIAKLLMEAPFSVIGWLPDGLGLIRSVDDARFGNENIVLMLDGSFRSLPSRPDRTVAVIPTP